MRKAQTDSLDDYRAFEIINNDYVILEKRLSTSSLSHSKVQSKYEKLREELRKRSKQQTSMGEKRLLWVSESGDKIR